MITRSQVRMARAALGWGVRELGKRAGDAANRSVAAAIRPGRMYVSERMDHGSRGA